MRVVSPQLHLLCACTALALARRRGTAAPANAHWSCPTDLTARELLKKADLATLLGHGVAHLGRNEDAKKDGDPESFVERKIHMRKGTRQVVHDTFGHQLLQS